MILPHDAQPEIKLGLEVMIRGKGPPCEAFHNTDYRYYRHETEIVCLGGSF